MLDENTKLKILLSYFIDNYGMPEDEEFNKYYSSLEEKMSKKAISKNMEENNEKEENYFEDIIDLTYLSLSDMKDNLTKEIRNAEIMIRNIENTLNMIRKGKKPE